MRYLKLEENLMLFDTKVVDGVRIITITYPADEIPPREITPFLAELLVMRGAVAEDPPADIRLTLKQHNIPEGYRDWAMGPGSYPCRPDLRKQPHTFIPPNSPYTGGH